MSIRLGTGRRPLTESAEVDTPTRGLIRGRHLQRWWLLGLTSSAAIAAFAVLTRGEPTTKSDSGIFLSVAGRLLAGDRLYRDVFDNKDPLFYYVQALALWAAGWRGPFLLDIVWLAVASIGAHLLLREITGDLLVAVFGQVVYPLFLTGIWYNAGSSETPGLSLLPLLAYLAYRHSPALAGLVAAAVLLLKLNLLPVVAAVSLAALVRPVTGRFRWREMLPLLAASGGGVAAVFLVLTLRGEAGAYVATLRENVHYASYALRVEHWPSGVRGHLDVVRYNMPWLLRRLVMAIVAFVLVLIVVAGKSRLRLLLSPLMALTGAVAIGTLVTLASTALWNHHLDVLAFPLLCAASLTLASARTRFDSLAGEGVGTAVACVVAGAYVVVSLLLRTPSLSNTHLWSAQPQRDVSNALEKAARASGDSGVVSYFHLGAVDEMGQGAFLGGSFKLACPRFHQYPYTSAGALRQTARCVAAKRPQLIAVTPSFRVDSSIRAIPPPDAWRQFISHEKAYLRANCSVAVRKPVVSVYRCRSA